MIKPSIRLLLSLPSSSPALGKIVDLFAVMLSHFRHAPLARKRDGGAPLSAGGPTESEIPPQSDAPHVEIGPKCLKDERAETQHTDGCLTLRQSLNVSRSMGSVLCSRMRKRPRKPRSINQIILLCSDDDVIFEILSVVLL